MLALWKSFILPHHDYCCQLWSPNKIKDIQQLEIIQCNFIKRIANARDSYWYWYALMQFKIKSLQRQRERFMIFYGWKIIENHAPPLMNRVGDKLMYCNNNFHCRLGRTCGTLRFAKKSSNALVTTKMNSSMSIGA